MSVFLRASALLGFLPSGCLGKFASGTITLGGPKEENKFVYLAKMAYVPGDGSYALRVRTQRPQLVPGQEGRQETRLSVSIFLDEEWETHQIDKMYPVCDRIAHARSTRHVNLKAGTMSSEWSDWERGGLKQVVRPHIW